MSINSSCFERKNLHARSFREARTDDIVILFFLFISRVGILEYNYTLLLS